ncbi:type VI secretion system Vgr family protein [Vitiosangium sp. GDMCC 1.1324]|uniref:type VI secretion system Vgr family protein n=1 Tax=Vitiosangium sp. (strain GDMCC 1.1324) TaxID=2138576 RepID=UPI000D33A97F|nr:type VI secretion system tip protein VgrG [Vitiosangium sp. GDMCC 1.1324]PTL85567.1 type VI secretion system tip protein VgrG [Vitiosangium sp. GDMCC 1.1324]
MGAPERPAFLFRIGSQEPEALVVSGFTGREGLSSLFEFQVDFHPLEDTPLEAESLLGTEALLTVQLPGDKKRHVHGRVRALDALGQQGGRWRYRAWVVPQAWWLTQVKRSRIFQSKTVPQIVKAVLEEGGVKVKLSLSDSHEAREYCTQYRETDFAFVSRLMEWEGLFYFFEHTEGGHELVVGDKPNVHEPLPGGAKLPLRENDKRAANEEFVSSLQRVHRLRPGKVHLKDYDFEKPALDVSGKTQDSSNGQDALEVYDYPGEYVAPGVGKGAAKVRLEEAVQAARTLEGEGVCPRLTAGYRFEVEDEGTHSGEYVAVEVVHRGRQPETPGIRESLGNLYRNSFKCMPSNVPFRPRRTTPVPHLNGLQTATVVGPGGEEIHTDEHGRIKVQFHWDREGQRDDKASCWVRVSQTWGGPAWGAVYLPRIGQEVVVRFLEGNPDRPLIAGTVYNGGNPTPYSLPDDKTKSTLKSASSLGSDGFNEFRIEDAAGEEEIFTHAQKDEDLVTENDKDQLVRGYEDLLVKKDRKRTVEGNQRLRVVLDDASLIEGNQSTRVAGNRTTRTSGSHDESIEGNQAITVAKNETLSVTQTASESVGLARTLTVGGAFLVDVALAKNEAVGGLKSVQVAGSLSEYVIGSRQEVVSKDSALKVGGNFQTEIKGQLSETVGKDVKNDVGKNQEVGVKESTAMLAKSFELKADKFSLVVNGKLILSMEKGGKVQLAPKTFTLDGSDIKVKGAKVKLEPAGSMTDKSVKLKELEAIKEAQIKKSVHVEMVLPDNSALAGQKFEVKLPDGSKKSGSVDGSGAASVSEAKPGRAEISFPDLAKLTSKKE